MLKPKGCRRRSFVKIYEKLYVSICNDYISDFFRVLKIVKQQLAHLKKPRLASVEHFKKQKLEQTQLHDTEQLRTNDDQFSLISNHKSVKLRRLFKIHLKENINGDVLSQISLWI